LLGAVSAARPAGQAESTAISGPIPSSFMARFEIVGERMESELGRHMPLRFLPQ